MNHRSKQPTTPPPASQNLLHRSPVCRVEPPEGYSWTPPPFRLALPYYEGDYERARDLLLWVADLSPGVDRELTIFTDEGIAPNIHRRVMWAASQAFSSVKEVFIPPTTAKWPGSNNWVFLNIMRHMAAQETPQPWLLLETDVVPVTTDWVFRLEEEYSRARKPFMGSWVEYYDIINGAAVYPPNVGPWSPTYFAMDVTRALAYDCAIAPDIIWFSHNANHLMPHVWFSRENGRPGGFVPKIPEWNPRMAEWVLDHNAVLAHRCKDGKLIEFLRSRRQ